MKNVHIWSYLQTKNNRTRPKELQQNKCLRMLKTWWNMTFLFVSRITLRKCSNSFIHIWSSVDFEGTHFMLCHCWFTEDFSITLFSYSPSIKKSPFQLSQMSILSSNILHLFFFFCISTEGFVCVDWKHSKTSGWKHTACFVTETQERTAAILQTGSY